MYAPKHAVDAFDALCAAAAERRDLGSLVDDVVRRFDGMAPAAAAAVQLLNAADVGTLEITRTVFETLREHVRGERTRRSPPPCAAAVP